MTKNTNFVFLALVAVISLIYLSGCSQVKVPIKSENNSKVVDPTLTKVKINLEKAYIETDKADVLINEAFLILRKYIKNPKNKEISSNKIMELSKDIRVLEWDGSRIIEYTQPPEIFGNSGKDSWHLFQYKASHIASIIQAKAPLHIEAFRVRKIGSRPFLYTFGTNYEVNQHKVYIHAYHFNDSNLTIAKSLKWNNKTNNSWGYNEKLGLIYSRKGYSLYIDSVSKDGVNVIIKGWKPDSETKKISLHLSLGEDGVYYVQE